MEDHLVNMRNVESLLLCALNVMTLIPHCSLGLTIEWHSFFGVTISILVHIGDNAFGYLYML